MNPQNLLAQKPAAQPELSTSRLLLRPFRESDVDQVQQLLQCKAIADMTLRIPHPYPDGAAKSWIETQATKWKSSSGAIFAVCLKYDHNKILGAVGLELNVKDENAELGYWIGQPFWGNGICSEAVRAIIQFGFDKLGLQRIHAGYFSRNLASGRVLEKVGMEREGLLKRHVKKNEQFEDLVLCAIVREHDVSTGS